MIRVKQRILDTVNAHIADYKRIIADGPMICGGAEIDMPAIQRSVIMLEEIKAAVELVGAE